MEPTIETVRASFQRMGIKLESLVKAGVAAEGYRSGHVINEELSRLEAALDKVGGIDCEELAEFYDVYAKYMVMCKAERDIIDKRIEERSDRNDQMYYESMKSRYAKKSDATPATAEEPAAAAEESDATPGTAEEDCYFDIDKFPEYIAECAKKCDAAKAAAEDKKPAEEPAAAAAVESEEPAAAASVTAETKFTGYIATTQDTTQDDGITVCTADEVFKKKLYSKCLLTKR